MTPSKDPSTTTKSESSSAAGKEKSIRKLRIPILTIATILVTSYYLTNPKIEIADDKKAEVVSLTYQKGSDSILIMAKIVLPVTNKHIRSGFINRVEIQSNGIKLLPYTIKSVEIDKDWVPYNSKRKIVINATINYSLRESAYFTDNVNIQNFPPLRIQAFDNKNNAVLETGGKSSWFLVLIPRRLK